MRKCVPACGNLQDMKQHCMFEHDIQVRRDHWAESAPPFSSLSLLLPPWTDAEGQSSISKPTLEFPLLHLARLVCVDKADPCYKVLNSVRGSWGERRIYSNIKFKRIQMELSNISTSTYISRAVEKASCKPPVFTSFSQAARHPPFQRPNAWVVKSLHRMESICLKGFRTIQ